MVGVGSHEGREVSVGHWEHEVDGRPVWKCGDDGEVWCFGLPVVVVVVDRVLCVNENVDSVPPKNMQSQRLHW